MSEDHGQRLRALEQDLQAMRQEQTAQMNRLLALDALMASLLARLPSDVLRSLAGGFEERWMAAMAQLPPALQRQKPWQQHLDWINQCEREAFAAEQDDLRGSAPKGQERAG